MNFWDRFVLCVHAGLGLASSTGRETAGRLFDLAFSRGALLLPEVSNASILALMVTSRLGSAVRDAAADEVGRRDLVRSPYRLWRAARGAGTLRVTELVELHRAGDRRTVALTAAALFGRPFHPAVSALVMFHSRLALVSPHNRDTAERAQRRFMTALIRYCSDYPLGAVEFPVVLYRHVLTDMRVVDHILPFTPPRGTENDWYERLPGVERSFLERCSLDLSDPDVVALFLHFYGGLSVGQMAEVWRPAAPEVTADGVVLRLGRAWESVLC